VGALPFAKSHLAEGGWFLAVEPNAGDQLGGNLHPLGLIAYASSHNLSAPNAVSQGGTAPRQSGQGSSARSRPSPTSDSQRSRAQETAFAW